ncbi:MAG: GntR family transcriptional regulator [Acidobacteria bacterium]|nr:GntR family transcriptional regulator [Acidobacteriota bacterium]
MREGTDSTSLAAEVYGVVRRRILRGDLAIGESISRRKIAADLSTSLPPVTEALLRLECEGLLEHRARAGTRVRVPSPEDVTGHAIVCEALEVEAAIRLTRVATARERAELRKLAERVDALALQADRLTYVGAHQKLHVRMAECSRCSALCEAIEKRYALASLWLAAMRQPWTGDGAHRPHEELVEGVVSGDPDVAAAAVRRHVADGLRRSLEVLEPYLRATRRRGDRFRRVPERTTRTPDAHSETRTLKRALYR